MVACLLLVSLTGCAGQAEAPHNGGRDDPAASDRVSDDVDTAPTPSTPAPPAGNDDADDHPSARAGAGAALAALDTLAVKGRAPRTGYDRALFGQPWLDTDRNGCDTRNDVLASSMRDAAYRPGTSSCVVATGLLDDPYTGTLVHFVRGDGSLVDIDHVVALGNAWVTGAQQWPIRKRAALANDALNLLAVDSGANRQKGDGDTATWLPPAKGFRCEYVARQVAVKAKYALWVTQAEAAAMRHVLSTCPDQPLPPDSGAPTIAPLRVRAPATQPSPRAARTGTVAVRRTEGNSGVFFINCDAAQAESAAPVHVGDPGYGRHLDRDGDGVGCE